MRYIKILAVVVLPFLLISWLWSQDLTAAAKKEKERREAAKAKKVTVITNADLASVKKKAAVATGETGETTAEGEGAQAEGANPESAANPAENTDTSAQEALPMGTGTGTPGSAEDAQKALLEGNYLKAKEYADLLETKVNALWQTFYNMDDMTPKDQIQQQIADTFDKYQLAREDENKAKEELDLYLSTIKKD
jgi:hypothetical protein